MMSETTNMSDGAIAVIPPKWSAEELADFREGVLKSGEEWQLLMPELLRWGLR